MLHAVEAGDHRQTIDDMLAHAVRGLDALCIGFGFREQNLLQELPPDVQDTVRHVLRNARAEIVALARKLAGAGRSHESGRLAKIAERAEQTPAAKARDFGLAVADILRTFGLRDADVAERYYQSQAPAPSWQQVLSIYRGATLHEGGLELPDAKRVADAVAVWHHLHDILGRLILKMVAYSGGTNRR